MIDYEAIRDEPGAHGWYDGAVAVCRRAYPAIPPADLDAILAQCGVAARKCRSCNCGYQGSMSPTDFVRLRELLAAWVPA